MRLRSQFLLSAERNCVSALIRIRRRATPTVALTLIILASLSVVFLDQIVDVVARCFSGEVSVSSVRVVFATLGGSLVGATAIAFSLVMFAIQVNIERTPHGLFRRISSDALLVSSFLLTFILAILITCASLVPNVGALPPYALFVFWGTAAVLLLLFIAFQRALRLINPRDQIHRIESDSRKDMRRWRRRAERATPLLGTPEKELAQTDSPFDSRLAVYWQLNPGWSNAEQSAVRQCISLAKRYAATGDHEVSRDALEAVVGINRLYVDTRGPTFISSNSWLDLASPTDAFISDTLEQLRQAHHGSLNAADEVFAEQTMQCMQELVSCYLRIEYSSPHFGKDHANIATSYLVNATKACIPRDHADLVMDGTRMIGELGSRYLACDETIAFSTITEALSFFGTAGAFRDEYLPATQVAMQHSALLSLQVIVRDRPDIHHAALRIRESVKAVALAVLSSPDPNPLSNKHDTFLGPYYSAASYRALPHALERLMEAIGKSENPDVQFRNLEGWSDGLYQDVKEEMIKAFEKDSSFVLTLVQFIKSVSRSLMIASDLPNCPSHLVEKLEHHARWLAWVLSCVPDSDVAVRKAESFGITEAIFEIGQVAARLKRTDYLKSILELMVSWAIQGGARGQGWGTLGTALLGAACLAESCPGDEAIRHLDAAMKRRIADFQGIGPDVRERAALDLQNHPTDPHALRYSAIENASATADRARLASILGLLAASFVPPGNGEA